MIMFIFIQKNIKYKDYIYQIIIFFYFQYFL